MKLKTIDDLQLGGTLQIAVNHDHLEKLFEVERALSEIGVTFDTGTGTTTKKDLGKEKLFLRDWELDFSLEGARFDDSYAKQALKDEAMKWLKELKSKNDKAQDIQIEGKAYGGADRSQELESVMGWIRMFFNIRDEIRNKGK